MTEPNKQAAEPVTEPKATTPARISIFLKTSGNFLAKFGAASAAATFMLGGLMGVAVLFYYVRPTLEDLSKKTMEAEAKPLSEQQRLESLTVTLDKLNKQAADIEAVQAPLLAHKNDVAAAVELVKRPDFQKLLSAIAFDLRIRFLAAQVANIYRLAGQGEVQTQPPNLTAAERFRYFLKMDFQNTNGGYGRQLSAGTVIAGGHSDFEDKKDQLPE